MSPRRRTLDDDKIFHAVRRAIGRAGPDKLTLGDVAAEVGLAPATLIQRFGSKRKLLLAYAGWRAKYVTGVLNELIDGVSDAAPLGDIIATLLEQTVDLSSTTTIVNHVAAFQFELADAEFRSRAAYYAKGVVDAIVVSLQMAQQAGELRSDDELKPLAYLIYFTFVGALVTWVVEQQGPVRPWVTRAVDLVLAPYRTERPAGR